MLAFAAEKALFRFDSNMGIRHICFCRFYRRCRFLCRNFRLYFHFRRSRCFRFCRSRCGSGLSSCRRAAENLALEGSLHFLLFPRFPGLRQGKAVGGAAIGTDAAGDAFLPVDSPGAVSSIYGNGIRRAVMFAFAAEKALFRVYPDMGIRHIDFCCRFCHCSRRLFCRRFHFHRGCRPSSHRRAGAVHGNFTGISQVAAQGEAFPGAVVDTGAAVHAGFQVNTPGAAAAVHGNGAGGAVPHALAAEDTFHNVVYNVAPVIHGSFRHIDGRHFALHLGYAVFLLHLEDDFRFFHVRRRGFGVHVETFLGAYFHAAGALDAGKGVDFPGARGPVHGNGTGRAGAHALTAEDAAADVVDDPAPVMGLVNLRLYGIGGGYRRLEHVGEGLFHVNEKTHGVPPYLSQQLMQGSMVRMMLGTSASSHPFSIFTRAARLALVGVRRRNRSRFFVPFPFT